MKSFSCLLFTVYCLLFLSSCDKIEYPYLPKTDSGPTDTTTEEIVRKVLVEDFTGHKCPNCPKAGTAIDNLKSTYGEKIISIAIHCAFYATPAAPPYDYDFRTAQGDDIEQFFTVPYQPIGMVNRKGFPASNYWMDYDKWVDSVAAILARPPDAHIKITNSYNSATRVLNTSIRTELLTAMSGTYNLAVFLTEDSIVKPQTMPDNSTNANYIHRHVLRDGITSTIWGDALVFAGDTAVKTYTYTLPPNFKGLAPDENKCYVVAYIYDAATYEVIQAEEKKIK